MPTHRDFFDAFLKRLDLPVRPSGRRALACVSIFESSEGNEHWNNPLACEQPWPNATDYNSAGVKRYATFADGVAASATMYSGPHWDGVRAALKKYTTRDPILDAFSAAYTWTSVDFKRLEFNNLTDLLTRLSHPLY